MAHIVLFSMTSEGKAPSFGGQELQENKTQTNSRHDVTKLFLAGLARLEKDGDAGDVLKLFADNCTVANVMLDTHLYGKEGAQRFWSDYLLAFKDIESEFSRITETTDLVVLEWTSTGTLSTGQPIKYRGASFLTIADELIVDFMAYFDSRHFTTHLSHA